jgi:hypothetical protein
VTPTKTATKAPRDVTPKKEVKATTKPEAKHDATTPKREKKAAASVKDVAKRDVTPKKGAKVVPPSPKKREAKAEAKQIKKDEKKAPEAPKKVEVKKEVIKKSAASAKIVKKPIV